MTIDFNRKLYDPVYRVLGVVATITPAGTGVPFEIKVIEVTEPAMVELGGGHIEARGFQIPSTRPVFSMRARDLAAAEVDVADIIDAEVSLNGAIWTIKNHQPHPDPNGAASGQIFVALERRDDAV